MIKMVSKVAFEPYSVIWHTDNICNSNCKYCFADSKYSTKEVINDNWERVVEEINKNKSIKRVSFIGGEPLLVTNLPKIVRSLRKDILINIDSNLTKIKEKWSPVYKRVYFCTTVDSVYEKVHRKTRGHSTTKTLEGIKFLIEKGINVLTVVVVNKHNLDTLEETVEKLFDIGVNKIGISRTRMSGRALFWGYEYFYGENVFEFKGNVLKTLKKLIYKYGKDKFLVYNLWHDKRFFDLGYEYEPSCKCSLFRLCIDWEGNAYPCELMPFYWDRFSKIYNIDKPSLLRDSLKNIFKNSDLFRFFRKRMLVYPIGCGNCFYKKKCNHGCRFYSFLVSGNLLAKDIVCGADSVYDVLGYKRYSPLFDEGKKRYNSDLAVFLEKNKKRFGDEIYDLGCGGGVWSFFLEDLGKKVIGIDKNKTMIVMANEFKELKNKNSVFFCKDIKNFDFKKSDSVFLLDNLVTIFDEKDFMIFFEKVKKKTNKVFIEVNKNELSEGVFNYSFNGFEIKEEITKSGREFFNRKFVNKQTGAKKETKSYVWNESSLRNILEKFGGARKHDLEKSNIFEVTLNQ